MNNISDHISYQEATDSPTARRLGLDNTPPSDVLLKMNQTAIQCFEPIRKEFGIPIHIDDMYRSNALNKAVGGVADSQHVLGEAIDFSIPNKTILKAMFLWAKDNVSYKQLIWEFDSWIHISLGTEKETLVANTINGKTVYSPYA